MADARILSFNVGGQKGTYFSPEELTGIGFRIESEEGFHIEEKRVQILLNIHTDAEVKVQQNEVQEVDSIGYFRIGFTFEIDNFDDLVKEDELGVKKLHVDGILMRHLLAIAYSTARGMILVKTRGTLLEGSILPIIDPNELMEKEE